MQQTSITVRRDVEFARRDTGPLLLDLYRPANTTAPVVVWLHGGGWFTGDRTLAPDLSRFFAERGIAMASIEYRLSAAATFPAQLHDVRCAIRYLRGHAARWHLNPDRIGVWGSSAGGHLAALAGLTGHMDRLEGEDEGGDASVRAVAESYGPSDLSQSAAQMPDGSPSPETRLFGARPDQAVDRARAASPLYRVRHDAPAFQISHGTADTVVPQRHSQRLHTALNAAGAVSELYLVDGYRHGFLNPGGRLEAGITEFFDDGRLHAEGQSAATLFTSSCSSVSTTFGFDTIGDFFAHHLIEKDIS
ncbi:alpha/beta hydrolase [Mycolicibacterium litorale]|uniref:alpha/beta hydrolase n=1 Tax=Mycolicibacterium litorale TaxID=758802 RepID=UPI0010E02169|nr:alpha/beta hydrolase [Mycolicibacterium litorale]TDY09064.1 acetyl esterase/lipase [Mycolicibacterium litorale]